VSSLYKIFHMTISYIIACRPYQATLLTVLLFDPIVKVCQSLSTRWHDHALNLDIDGFYCPNLFVYCLALGPK
jgi:hypothetical protein